MRFNGTMMMTMMRVVVVMVMMVMMVVMCLDTPNLGTIHGHYHHISISGFGACSIWRTKCWPVGVASVWFTFGTSPLGTVKPGLSEEKHITW